MPVAVFIYEHARLSACAGVTVRAFEGPFLLNNFKRRQAVCHAEWSRLGQVCFCSKGGKPAAEGTFRLCFWGDVCLANKGLAVFKLLRESPGLLCGCYGCCSVCCMADTHF